MLFLQTRYLHYLLNHCSLGSMVLSSFTHVGQFRNAYILVPSGNHFCTAPTMGYKIGHESGSMA